MSARSSSLIEAAVTTRSALEWATLLLAWCVCSACGEQKSSGPGGGNEGAAASVLESSGPNPCQGRVATWQAEQASINGKTVAERLTQIGAAAGKVGQDPEGCTAELIGSAVADELRKVVILEAAGAQFPAAVVYSCRELSEGTQCVGRIADDTAHLSEVGEDAAAVPAAAEAKIRMLPEYPLSSMQWYGGLDAALLQDARSAKALAAQTNGTLTLPKATEANLLFAIGRAPSGEYHKWVWVLR